MVKLLVTGKSGQIVSALARLARVADGVELLSIGRPEVDLTRPETIAPAIAAAQPDVMVNAAAYTAVDKAEEDRETAFEVNAEGAGAVARASEAVGVPIIHISSDYVFDGSKTSAYVESDPARPISVYGASKLAGEQAVMAANPRHVVLRTSWLYSAGGSNFLLSMLRLAQDRPELRIVADQHGCPTWAADAAAGILTVAQRLADGGGAYGTFHMTAAGGTTWYGFADAIMSESALLGGPSVPVRPITTAEYPTAAKRPANSRLDCTRLALTYGVRLPDWRESLSECIGRALESATMPAKRLSVS